MDIRLRRIFALLAFTAVLSGLLAFLQNGQKATKRDFVSYWAAGRLLRIHHNPYAVNEVLTIEQSVGYSAARPLVMRNPPTALPITLLLGYLPLRAASAVWTFFIVSCLIFSIHMIRNMHGSPPNSVYIFGYLFAPCFACLMAGQSGMWILLGLTVFLQFYDSKPLLAGLGLAVCTIKPNLLLPFALVMIIWMLKRRQARILFGAIGGLIAASVIAISWRPSVWSDYLSAITNAGIGNEFIPTVSTALRLVVHPQWEWLQYIPCMLACVWAIWYFRRNAAEWSWNSTHGALLVLVSLWTAPYSWPTDEVVALPALLGLAYITSAQSRRPIALYVLFAANAIVLVELFSGLPFTRGFYIWTTSAWLGCYLYGIHRYRTSPAQ
jgi:Glycosyltransferase family 87